MSSKLDRLAGDGGWISTTVWQDMAESRSDILLSNDGMSLPKWLKGWYSLTVDRDDILECDCELLELLDDVVVYEDRLLRLSENLCLGDLGLDGPVTSMGDSLKKNGFDIGWFCMFLVLRVRGNE